MAVRRIRVEPVFGAVEPSFGPSAGDWTNNVTLAQEWLRDAFARAAEAYRFNPAPEWEAYLGNPPFSVLDWTLRRAAGQPDPRGTPWMKDAAMAIYAYEHNLNVEPDRNRLTRAERRSADTRAQYFVSTNRIWPKGRPVDVDVALLLFLIFSIEALVGRRFPQSRPGVELNGDLRGKRPPGGPAFRLLRAGYSLASVRHHVMPSGPETTSSVAKVARQDGFKAKIFQVRLEPWVGIPDPKLGLPDIVANHPNQCAILFAEALAATRSGRT